MSKVQALTRGARATFYRDGEECYSACDIPVTGAFTVRSLPPGRWVVRDSCGGERAFEVRVGEEVTTILSGDVVGVTGEPGVSGGIVDAAHRVGPGGGVITSPDQVAVERNVAGRVGRVQGGDPVETSAAPSRPRKAAASVGDETARVPGAAGSSVSEDVPIVAVGDLGAPAKAA